MTPVLAEGIRSLFEPEFAVVAVVSDGRELCAAANHRPTSSWWTSACYRSMASRLLCRCERRVWRQIVFLTMHACRLARRAMEAGAVGFVLKHSIPSELLTAIRAALQGKTYITPMIAGELLQSYRAGETRASDAPARLTVRQREVLQLIAEGRSAKEVAAMLQISVRTAEAHKARILESLGPNTAEWSNSPSGGIISIE
jgi:DNA-binding NarL/FixJ family response regulator